MYFYFSDFYINLNKIQKKLKNYSNQWNPQ